jgi:class 3 adenylate cyclase
VETGKNSTVLFMDIAGSTSLIARLGSAAAGETLRGLLDALTRLVQRHEGTVVKSDGDDLVCVFAQGSGTTREAAQAAIEAQNLARDHGLKLYAGLHTGEVEFREVLGRQDIFGLAVNAAARLHKLVEDAPGFIFLSAETAAFLPEELLARLGRFGTRNLKGIGTVEVQTLDWNEDMTVAPTSFASLRAPVQVIVELELCHGEQRLVLRPEDSEAVIGRSRDSRLHIDDPATLASSRHAKLQWKEGSWLLKDLSRNGTFVRFAGSDDTLLLRGDHCLLQRDGEICLGRPFEQDPARQFRVSFHLGKS